MPHFNKLLPVRELLCQTKRSSLFCHTKRTPSLCQTKRTRLDSAPCIYFFKPQAELICKKSRAFFCFQFDFPEKGRILIESNISGRSSVWLER